MKLFSQRVISRLAAVFFASALSGCFEFEGAHLLENYGDSDAGGYRLTMPKLVYDLARLNAQDEGRPDPFIELRQNLQRFSNPRTRRQGDNIVIEDVSGFARMEHIYDNLSCAPASNGSGLIDCAFRLKADNINFPGWEVEWTVVLKQNMEVLQSNHHNSRLVDGKRRLIWRFEGSGGRNSLNIQFKVRVPRA